ncbi:MAG: DNA replication/repair protein RecF [Candidatus Saccharimonadales bacterium]
MITNIRLQNFRSYKDASFEFDPGVNVIVGPNASGKTNLLEAILLITRGKSYRVKDADLIFCDDPWARIDADLGSHHRTVKLELDNNHLQKSFIIEDQTTARLTAIKQIPTILFEPNDLLMLHSSPELRRSFLDELIEQTDASYGKLLSQYKRTLLQRNRLLKNGSPDSIRQLFVWDIRLSELAAQVVSSRLGMIDKINQQASQIYASLANQATKLTATYSTTLPLDNYATSFLKKLEKDQPLDIIRGFTAAGPHREDVVFSLDGQPIAISASRGESRTALLSLKIIELKIVEAIRKERPILLLDDVFSELDGARRKALTEYMKDYQTFITTTDADVVMKSLSQKHHIIATDA